MESIENLRDKAIKVLLDCFSHRIFIPSKKVSLALQTLEVTTTILRKAEEKKSDDIISGDYLEYNGIRIGSQVRCFSSEPMIVKAIKGDKTGIWFLCESKGCEGDPWTAWFHESYTKAYE